MLWNKKLTMIIRATVAAAALSWLAPQAIAETPAQQDDVWTVRKAGLGLMMSERSEAKPVSVIEDGAVLQSQEAAE